MYSLLLFDLLLLLSNKKDYNEDDDDEMADLDELIGKTVTTKTIENVARLRASRPYISHMKVGVGRNQYCRYALV